MVNFFIDRPVFAWVIAIVIMMAGALAIMRLPIEQYPRIAPPAVTITATYPGASAKTLEDAVTQVIEQKMNGLDHLRYISSTSDSSGQTSITLTFDPEANPDIAQVQVQNKLQLAMPQLPQEVQQQGVTVTKSSASFLLVAAFYSADGKLSQFDLSDYVASHVLDPISRVNGVGETNLFGQQHSMRVWLDLNKLNSYQMTTGDITTAIKAQNAEVTAGQLGGAPAMPSQQLNATIIVQTRLETPEQFGAILLRVNQDGSQLHLRDVARIELGSEDYQMVSRYDRHPATGLAVKLAAGANALDTAEAVKQRIHELSPFFPSGMTVSYPYDTTPFVRISITEVVKTLFEAIGLVFLVMLLFLQNIRATLIPTIAVPVVLLGTFAVLSACGFTINTLTMFGMVLAIGLLVDDAIVVVENVERVMAEEGLSPHDAARKSMGQITGALVGIALVLSAVFVPMAFFSGSTGAIYRQFALTVVSSMVLSVLVALILTPALCATILKSGDAPHTRGGFLGWFNRSYDRGSRLYQRTVQGAIRRPVRVLLMYALLAGGLAFLFLRLPTAFLPDEDQGIMFTQIVTPPGSTTERTLETVKKVEDFYLDKEKDNVQGLFTVAGFGFNGRGQNVAIAFTNLRDWSERQAPERRLKAILGRSMMALFGLRDAMVFAFAPPAVIELGNATGFDFQLVDRVGLGHEKLLQARNQLLGMAMHNPALVAVRPNGLDDTPQYRVTIDQEKAQAQGLTVQQINDALSTVWGSSYVNDFIDQGRVKKVYMQADAPFRMLPDDIGRLHLRSGSGAMVPLSSVVHAQWTYGSPRLERFNGVSSAEIMGAPAPGHSSGEAMAIMESLAKQLPPGIGYEWSGLSYEERLSGSQAPALYGLSLLVVFLCLAALYESWSVPFSVMLVVPLGVLGAVAAATLRGLPDDVYFQVGLLTTIGLSAKNAILIVEFAKSLNEQGMELFEATVEAARQRLRPILMTSLAFILGVMPLAIANGAGSGSQNAIGTGVMGGMISATFLAVLFVPVFFVTVRRLFTRRQPQTQVTVRSRPETAASAPPLSAAPDEAL